MIKFKDRDKFKFTKEFIESLPKIIDPVTNCWLYQGYCLRGYGVMCISGKDYYISRLALVAFHDIEYENSNIDTCHKPSCPSKNCFNPDHIYAGTHGQNMRDKIVTRTHQQHKKLVCPKCGGPYTTFVSKTGDRKGKAQRRCLYCYNKSRNKG
jgi:hypothetical protein